MLGCFGLVRRFCGRGFGHLHCSEVRVRLQDVFRIIFIFHRGGFAGDSGSAVFCHRQVSFFTSDLLKLSVLLVMAVFGDTRCALRFLGEKIFKKIAHTLRGVAQSVQIGLDIIPQVTVAVLFALVVLLGIANSLVRNGEVPDACAVDAIVSCQRASLLSGGTV